MVFEWGFQFQFLFDSSRIENRAKYLVTSKETKMEILKNSMKLIRERVIMVLLFSFFTTNVSSQNNIDFLRTVKRYQDSVKFVWQIPPTIDTTTFNINTYLRLFNKLKLPSGFRCQYTYRYDSPSGTPLLYVVKDSFDLESYLNREYREYIKQRNIDTTTFTPKNTKFFKQVFVFYGFAYQNSVKKFILPEDSEAGYLQYLYFNQFGEEFATNWYPYSVIFSNDELNRLYKFYLNDKHFIYDNEKFKGLLNLNTSPIIEMKKNSCIITWYEIMANTGIFKRTYEISRSTPYTIVKKEYVKILDIYDDRIY